MDLIHTHDVHVLGRPGRESSRTIHKVKVSEMPSEKRLISNNFFSLVARISLVGSSLELFLSCLQQLRPHAAVLDCEVTIFVASDDPKRGLRRSQRHTFYSDRSHLHFIFPVAPKNSLPETADPQPNGCLMINDNSCLTFVIEISPQFQLKLLKRLPEVAIETISKSPFPYERDHTIKYKELFNNPRREDVEFEFACGSKIKGHRFVFANSCEFMDDLLHPQDESPPTSIFIDWTEPRTFRTLKKFIYTDKICFEDYDNLVQFLAVIHRMRFPFRNDLIFSALLDDTTVFRLLVIAFTLNDPASMEICIPYIESHAPKLLLDPAFCGLPAEIVFLLLKRNRLAAPETDVLVALIQWGQHQLRSFVDEEDTESRLSLPEILRDLVTEIELEDIPYKEFAKYSKESPFLDKEQTLFCFTDVYPNLDQSSLPKKKRCRREDDEEFNLYLHTYFRRPYDQAPAPTSPLVASNVPSNQPQMITAGSPVMQSPPNQVAVTSIQQSRPLQTVTHHKIRSQPRGHAMMSPVSQTVQPTPIFTPTQLRHIDSIINSNPPVPASTSNYQYQQHQQQLPQHLQQQQQQQILPPQHLQPPQQQLQIPQPQQLQPPQPQQQQQRQLPHQHQHLQQQYQQSNVPNANYSMMTNMLDSPILHNQLQNPMNPQNYPHANRNATQQINQQNFLG